MNPTQRRLYAVLTFHRLVYRENIRENGEQDRARLALKISISVGDSNHGRGGR